MAVRVSAIHNLKFAHFCLSTTLAASGVLESMWQNYGELACKRWEVGYCTPNLAK
jgi:hypothetical protein